MKPEDLHINLSLNFSQIVDLIKQLPYDKRLKVKELLSEEEGVENQQDSIVTHFASENVLNRDWSLAEESEAWKDL